MFFSLAFRGLNQWLYSPFHLLSLGSFHAPQPNLSDSFTVLFLPQSLCSLSDFQQEYLDHVDT